MNKPLLFSLVALVLLVTACVSQSPAASASPLSPTNTNLPTPLPPTPGDLPTTLPAIPTAGAPTPLAGPRPLENEARRQWAVAASSDVTESDPSQATGAPDALSCGDQLGAWAVLQPDPQNTEHSLSLSYRAAVMPSEVNIVQSGNPGGIIRVELINSANGQNSIIYSGTQGTVNDCPATFSIPAQSEGEVDTVVVTLVASAQPTQIDAVELVGTLPGFVSLQPLWRIPIPESDPEGLENTPGGLAVDEQNNLYLGNGRRGLYRFDFEGKLLHAYTVPTGANISDVSSDAAGNLLVTDTASKWFITLSPAGDQINAGGEDFGDNNPAQVAVSPLDGNIYLLDQAAESARIRVYTGENAGFVRDLALESGRFFGIAIDQAGNLYTSTQTEPLVLVINPQSGETINKIGVWLSPKPPPAIWISTPRAIYTYWSIPAPTTAPFTCSTRKGI